MPWNPVARPYDRQPVGPQELSEPYKSWSNFVISGNSGLVNLSSRLKTAFTVSGTVGLATNRAGQAYSFSSSYLDIGAVQVGLDAGVNTEFTLIAVVDVKAAGSYPMIISGNSGGSDVVELRLFDGTGRPEFQCRNASGALPDLRGANSIVNVGPVCLVATYFKGAVSFIQDGKVLATGSGTADSFSFGTHSWRVGNRAVSGGFPLTGNINFAAVLRRGLSVPEAILLSLNPWQIFEDPFSSFFYTPASGGGGVSGTLAQTLANATLAASGTQTIRGTLAQTLAATTLAASGTTRIQGTLSLNLSAVTLAAAGTVGSPSSGTVVETLDNVTLSASGATTVRGTLAQTLANVVSAAAGTTTVRGTVTTTLGNDLLAASGSVGSAVSGSVVLTLSNATLAALGRTTIVGSVSYTTENTVATTSGTTAVLGSLASTLGNATLVASGTSGVTAAGAEWRFLKLWISKLGF